MKSAPFIAAILLFVALHAPLTAQWVWLDDFIFYEQEYSNWCWAATSQMILHYYGIDRTQAQIAYWANGGYNDTNWLYGADATGKGVDYILDYFGDIDSYGVEGYYTFSTITDQIDSGRPYAIRWLWDSGGGHIMPICGYDIDGSEQKVMYMDPLEQAYITDYDWFVQGGDHTWTHTLVVTSYPSQEETDITVTYPSESGIVWNAGSTHTIRWTSEGDIGDYVVINLFKESSFVSVVGDGATQNDGSYSWTVPDNLEESDRYYIKIYAFWDSSISDISDHYFTITNPAGGDPYEPNDTRDAAETISFSGSPPAWSSGDGPEIDPSTDQDWFAFSASSGDELTITCDATSDLDAEIVLYFGDTKIDGEDAGASGDDETMAYSVVNEGTYYIGIGYYSNIAKSSSTTANTGTYELTIEKESSDGDPYEPNDSRSEATLITFPESYNTWLSDWGTLIDPAGDQDWFAFYATAGESYFIDCELNSDLDAKLVLYCGEENVCLCDEGAPGESEMLYHTVSETGMHYLGIGHWSEIAKQTDVHHFDTGEYMLIIVAIDTDVAADVSKKPDAFQLHQNYPNPFNPSTRIDYAVKEPCNVSLVLFNLNGQMVQKCIDAYHEAGTYSMNVNMPDIPSGVYFYKIQMGDFEHVKKMIKME